VPQGVEAELHPKLLLTALLHLAQGDVHLLGEPLAQQPVLALQSTAPVAADLLRSAMTAGLVLLPKALYAAAAHPETLGHLADSFALLSGPHDASTQIIT
jgi:hypothetical protein